MYLNHRIRLSFFEHLEKWFAESLSNSWATVDAKKEELGSELQQHLLSCELRRENIETNISSVRAGSYLFTLNALCLHLEMIIWGGKSEQVLGETKCWGWLQSTGGGGITSVKHHCAATDGSLMGNLM